MRLTGPTGAVELARRNPFAAPWHRVTGRDAEGRRIPVCAAPLLYNSAEGVKASRADIRLGFVKPLCPQCFEEVRDAEDAAAR